MANLNDSPRVTQAIAGLEYKGDCCWVGRVVYQRYAVSAKDANSAVFFQLELTGLGSRNRPDDPAEQKYPRLQPHYPACAERDHI